jgi:hypothetical protein
MKKIILSAAIAIIATSLLHAQSPQKINYQAIVRNTAGQPLAGGTNVNCSLSNTRWLAYRCSSFPGN